MSKLEVDSTEKPEKERERELSRTEMMPSTISIYKCENSVNSDWRTTQFYILDESTKQRRRAEMDGVSGVGGREIWRWI